VKKNPKRYDGPDGVFYDKKHDEIFVLEWTGAKWRDLRTGRENGRVYRYWRRGKYFSQASLIGMTYCVRIGEL